MYKITQLDNLPKQSFRMLLDNNEYITFNFEYKPNQLGWFFGFQYGDVTYQNIRLTTSYNILRAYKSWLPFGLRCDTADGFEPMNQSDFATGYAFVYLLTASDVQAVEGMYYAKTTA